MIRQTPLTPPDSHIDGSPDITSGITNHARDLILIIFISKCICHYKCTYIDHHVLHFTVHNMNRYYFSGLGGVVGGRIIGPPTPKPEISNTIITVDYVGFLFVHHDCFTGVFQIVSLVHRLHNTSLHSQIIPQGSVGILQGSVGIPQGSVGIPQGSVGIPQGSVLDPSLLRC